MSQDDDVGFLYKTMSEYDADLILVDGQCNF